MEPEVWRSWFDIGLVLVGMVSVAEVEQERRSKRKCGFEKINERQCSHFLVNIGHATIVVVVVVVVVVVIRLAAGGISRNGVLYFWVGLGSAR
jgi:hypothetical protein